MEITATAEYDLKSITTLEHVNMFKERNPKKRMTQLVMLDGSIMTGSILLLCLTGHKSMILLLCVSAVFMLLLFISCLWLPKIHYRSISKSGEKCQAYKFTDDAILITSSNKGCSASLSMTYDAFYQVRETSEYLFLYTNKRQAFIVDKSTLEGGTINEIRVKFANTPGSKYNLLNY